MEVGGRTQYRTMVQGMPNSIAKEINKITRNFLWNGKPSAVNSTITRETLTEGGAKVMDINLRRDAIDLRRAQSFLNFEADRPRWAYVAEELMKLDIPTTQGVKDRTAAVNIFLQTWSTYKSEKRSILPASTWRMLRSAKRYNLVFAPPTGTKDLRNKLPAWFHLTTREGFRVNNNGEAEDCIRQNH
ncbi:hypothetical protein BKA70DRAFT_1102344, partial [Coprinopsis sp. MPI-PUGE-AT-0042]